MMQFASVIVYDESEGYEVAELHPITEDHERVALEVIAQNRLFCGSCGYIRIVDEHGNEVAFYEYMRTDGGYPNDVDVVLLEGHVWPDDDAFDADYHGGF